MKILYVDDAPFTRMLLKRCLTGAGHEAHESASGDAAVKLLQEQSFDLLITDLLMDGLSGLDVLRIAHQQYPHMPVIVLTADVQASTQDKCRELGAAAVYPKGSLYPNGQGLLDLLNDLPEQISS